MHRLRELWRRLNDPTISLRRAFSYWVIIFVVTLVVLLAAVYFGSGAALSR